MTIPERLIGPAILALAFAANAIHNHTALGDALGHIPGFYPIVFFIGIGVALPALALGRTVRREPVAARPLGVALSWRDAIAVLAALVIGCALAARPLGPIIAQPGGMERVATLFAQLLIASTAEVMLFLGVTGMSLRALLGGRHDWRFGLLAHRRLQPALRPLPLHLSHALERARHRGHGWRGMDRRLDAVRHHPQPRGSGSPR